MIAKIYQLFFQELIRYVTKMTCDKTAAEDIVQETFLRAMEHAEILDDMDERQCRSWLYKTSRNIFIDKVRRESAYPEAEEKRKHRTICPRLKSGSCVKNYRKKNGFYS